MTQLELHPDRLFQSDPAARGIARHLYERVARLPIISPHGHTDPAWFADNEPFEDATSLILIPDHYLFRGTPSRLWLDHVFAEVFGLTERLDAATAGDYYDSITAQLQTEAFRPRALLDRFNIEVITTFRPGDVVDPEREDFADNVDALGTLTGEDARSWPGYLAALRARREFFRSKGATATDHGHPTAMTANLDERECETLLSRCLGGDVDATSAELFRGQLLTDMAKMSIEDGLVMQIHPGSWRNHDPQLFAQYGRLQ